MNLPVAIRPFAKEDYREWLPLWDANNMGRGNPEVSASTWSRIITPDNPVGGLGAWSNGTLAGICHFIIHPTTGCIEPVCYMQDLFVSPDFRRHGIARAMVEKLEVLGHNKGWKRIYWLADSGNEAAANLYRNIGMKLDFTFHVLPLA